MPRLNSKGLSRIVLRIIEMLDLEDVIAIRDVCNRRILRRVEEEGPDPGWNKPEKWIEKKPLRR